MFGTMVGVPPRDGEIDELGDIDADGLTEAGSFRPSARQRSHPA